MAIQATIFFMPNSAQLYQPRQPVETFSSNTDNSGSNKQIDKNNLENTIRHRIITKLTENKNGKNKERLVGSNKYQPPMASLDVALRKSSLSNASRKIGLERTATHTLPNPHISKKKIEEFTSNIEGFSTTNEEVSNITPRPKTLRGQQPKTASPSLKPIKRLKGEVLVDPAHSTTPTNTGPGALKAAQRVIKQEGKPDAVAGDSLRPDGFSRAGKQVDRKPQRRDKDMRKKQTTEPRHDKLINKFGNIDMPAILPASDLALGENKRAHTNNYMPSATIQQKIQSNQKQSDWRQQKGPARTAAATADPKQFNTNLGGGRANKSDRKAARVSSPQMKSNTTQLKVEVNISSEQQQTDSFANGSNQDSATPGKGGKMGRLPKKNTSKGRLLADKIPPANKINPNRKQTSHAPLDTISYGEGAPRDGGGFVAVGVAARSNTFDVTIDKKKGTGAGTILPGRSGQTGMGRPTKATKPRAREFAVGGSIPKSVVYRGDKNRVNPKMKSKKARKAVRTGMSTNTVSTKGHRGPQPHLQSPNFGD